MNNKTLFIYNSPYLFKILNEIKRNLNFEIADPTQDYDLVIVTEAADLSVWSEYKKGKVIFDLID